MKPPQEVLDNSGPAETTHPAGCTYGGFSCGYWLIADDCHLEHWERHLVIDGETCSCGTLYPGASNCVVYLNATAEDAD